MNSLLTRRISSSPFLCTTAATASSNASAPSQHNNTPHIVTAMRTIRNQHNYRSVRNYTQLKQRHRFSNVWEFQWGQVETHAKTGHELEAFDNFARYRYEVGTDEGMMEIATQDLDALPARERYSMINKLLERQSKVKGHSDRGLMPRIKLTLKAAECWEEICRSEGVRSITELDNKDQFECRSCVHSVLNMVHQARFNHPQAISAAMRCVQIVNNVREGEEERQYVLDRTRAFVSQMDDGRYEDEEFTLDPAFDVSKFRPLAKTPGYGVSKTLDETLRPPLRNISDSASSSSSSSASLDSSSSSSSAENERTIASGSDVLVDGEVYESPQARRRRLLVEKQLGVMQREQEEGRSANESKNKNNAAATAQPVRLISHKRPPREEARMSRVHEQRYVDQTKWFKTEKISKSRYFKDDLTDPESKRNRFRAQTPPVDPDAF